MELDSLKIEAFAVLAQSLNYSKAAITLGISQPALSKKIARLEDELGVSLFVRSKKKVELSPAGHELVAYWKSKQEIDRDFISRIGGSSQNSGEIKIAGFSTVTSSFVVPALSQYSQRYRDINLEIFTRETRELPQMLLQGVVDLILHDEVIHRENVVCELIGNETLIHVVPKFGSPKDLPYLDHDLNDKITYTYLREQEKNLNIKRIFVDDIHSILSGVKSGLGQAVISEHLYDSKTMKKIYSKKKVYSPIYLCYLKRPYLPKIIKDVIEHLQNFFSII